MRLALHHAVPFAAALALAACSTTPSGDTPAGEANLAGATSQAKGTPTQRGPAAPAPGYQSRGAAPSARSIYYEFDQSGIRPESRSMIEANARYLREHPEVKVRIEGNADERGSAEYNLALGQRRAESVSKMIRLLGVPDGRVEAVSLGKEKPKRSGHDETSWQENRRSDIVY